MNTQHLKHFMAVAEELNFGRAAERIGMAQPPLSQSIRRLEESLGCRLFDRTQRRVRLTAAGAALIEHAREILQQVEYAQRAVLVAGETGITSLTIGFTPNALNESLPVAIQEIRRLVPGVPIHLRERSTSEQIEALLTGELDLGFFYPPNTEIRGIEARVVERSHLSAAIPADWDLAAKPSVWLKDLAELPLLMFPADNRPDVHAAIMTAFRAAGSTPRIIQEAAHVHMRLKLVAAGMGVALISDSAAPDGHPGVVMRPVEDLPSSICVELVLAWRRAGPAGARRIFAAAFEAAKRV